jgi:hypothetical protein
VKDVVKGSTGAMADGAPGDTKSCWIAEALYGVESPRVHLIRGWLSDVYDERRPGWMFVRLYGLTGRRVAALIRAGRIPAAPFSRLFGYLTARAADDRARLVTSRTERSEPRRASGA